MLCLNINVLMFNILASCTVTKWFRFIIIKVYFQISILEHHWAGLHFQIVCKVNLKTEKQWSLMELGWNFTFGGIWKVSRYHTKFILGVLSVSTMSYSIHLESWYMPSILRLCIFQQSGRNYEACAQKFSH